jgi:uncharacterized protein YPO0396
VTPYLKSKQHKKGWRHDSSGKSTFLVGVQPEFNPQDRQRKDKSAEMESKQRTSNSYTTGALKEDKGKS